MEKSNADSAWINICINFIVIYVYVHCVVSESDIWNSYVLTHTKEPIAEPLTTLPTKELEAEALKLFKVGTALQCT